MAEYLFYLTKDVLMPWQTIIRNWWIIFSLPFAWKLDVIVYSIWILLCEKYFLVLTQGNLRSGGTSTWSRSIYQSLESRFDSHRRAHHRSTSPKESEVWITLTKICVWWYWPTPLACCMLQCAIFETSQSLWCWKTTPECTSTQAKPGQFQNYSGYEFSSLQDLFWACYDEWRGTIAFKIEIYGLCETKWKLVYLWWISVFAQSAMFGNWQKHIQDGPSTF